MAIVIGAVGDRNPAYLTHREIDAAMALAAPEAEIRWVASDSDDVRQPGAFDGLWMLPGTPYRDEDAVHGAIRHAREEGMPILGTCGGFQHMALEFARNGAGIEGAAHEETDPDGAVIALGSLACSLVGEVRTVTAVPGTRVAEICGTEPFPGFHWCNYGLAPGIAERLAAAGLVISAHAQDAGVEAFELPAHPFYVATLFQPQVGSSERGAVLHPLLTALIKAASRTTAGSV